MMSKYQLIVLSMLSVFLTNAQSISTEAPSVSASAVNVPSKSLQIESSFNYLYDSPSTEFAVHGFVAPFVLIRYGIVDKIEIRATGSFDIRKNSFIGTASYFNDAGVGIKYEILDANKSTNLAFITHYSPYNFNEFNHVSTALIALSQLAGERHSLGANFGVVYDRSDALNVIWHGYDLKSSLIYNFKAHEQWTLFIECYSSLKNFRQFSSNNHYWGDLNLGVDFGFQFLLTDKIQLDYVSGFGLLANNQFHSLGFNILIPFTKKDIPIK